MSQEVLIERFIEALISGDRTASRAVVDECLCADAPAERIIEKLFWPTLEELGKLYRNDQLSAISHQFATRIMRMLADQMGMRLEQRESRGERLLIVCGPNEPNELGGQLVADVLEASGYEVFFVGGGIAHDEIISTLGTLKPRSLVLFSSAPSDLPNIRVMIDQLHDQGVCPELQIVVGGGVFNRAEGLAEEIGADVWVKTPMEMVEAIRTQAERRMGEDQRTVGRRRRMGRSVAA
ncbi:MAG: cobalamin B12-binding domain-containing protein [Phycisphaerales bacterium]